MLTAEEGPRSMEGLSTQVSLTPALSQKNFLTHATGPVPRARIYKTVLIPALCAQTSLCLRFPTGLLGRPSSALTQVRCGPESVSFNSRAGETFQFPHSMILNYTFPQKLSHCCII